LIDAPRPTYCTQARCEAACCCHEVEERIADVLAEEWPVASSHAAAYIPDFVISQIGL
jgi:hypothetical protein